MSIGTLAELLAPIPEAEFAARLRRRELTIWRGGDAGRLAALLDWPTLLEALASAGCPPNRLRMTRGGTQIHEAFFTQNGKPDLARVLKLVEGGASLLLQPLERTVPAVDTLVSDIRLHIRDHVESGVIVSTGPGGALAQHYDAEDLLIVQLEGSKRWFVHDTPVRNPVRKMRLAEPPAGGRLIEEVLQPGDLMLLPAGYWHHCENLAGRSMHLGLFFVPLSLAGAAERVWRRLLADERARAPISREDRAPDEDEIRSKLTEAISEMSLEDFFEGRD